jgi:hypothetical protein
MIICPARNSSSPCETVPVMIPILKLMARSGGAASALAAEAVALGASCLPQPERVKRTTGSAAKTAAARNQSGFFIGLLPPPAMREFAFRPSDLGGRDRSP